MAQRCYLLFLFVSSQLAAPLIAESFQSARTGEEKQLAETVGVTAQLESEYQRDRDIAFEVYQ